MQAHKSPVAEPVFASASLNESFLPEDIVTPPMHRPALPDDAPDPADEAAEAAQADGPSKDLQEAPDAEDAEDAENTPDEGLRSEVPEAEEAEQASAALQPVSAKAVPDSIQTAEEPTESTIEDMSFVRDARRKAFWRRPMVRAALGVLSVLLLVALVLQVAVQERDRLAVLEPRLKPWLDQICAPLQCSVAPLRQIESLVIESSSFNKVRGNVYRLNLSVRNKAPFPLAMPGIELALTDSQDQPVLRRVLLPAELGASAVIAAGGEWSGSLPVSVAASSQTARISGYRLLAFYP